ncbi:uracil-DNA glycosylase isoform X2 [Lacerta agilis]|uniref:uracil-DNA glycosylase isoform X2 n=1 Tax=Lacerta agilis TaxID=80427 RepID=UPI00141A5FD7|nr:uracil-DNA glycosylase isoform X2 [Lacerta agilis]
MIGQKTLLSFFSAAQAKKRSRSPEPVGAAEAGSPKRSKADAPSPQSPPLSPEQLERIRRNKEAALQRLASRISSLAPPEIAQDWRVALAGEFAKPYFAQLMDFVAAERKRYTVYPAVHQVFTWTQMCSIRDVKVVILGQDPYHGPNQAHGLCFSVQRPVPPPPRSTSTQCCSYSPSTPSQFPQREGLGAVHRRSGLLAKQQLGWCGLHALGGLCSEERQLYRQETAPHPTDSSPFTPVSAQGFLWL